MNAAFVTANLDQVAIQKNYNESFMDKKNLVLKELGELKAKLGRLNLKSVQDELVASLDKSLKKAQESFRLEIEVFEQTLKVPQETLNKQLNEAVGDFKTIVSDLVSEL